MNRREFFKLASLVASGATLAACQPAYQLAGGAVEDPLTTIASLRPTQLQALSRMTFGPRQSERQAVAKFGLGAWIDDQLHPAGIDDGPIEWRLRPFDILGLDAPELRAIGDQLLDGIDRERIVEPLRQATLMRQVYSRRQLQEKMVEFWTDHFNISINKGDCWFLKPVDDREVIRTHALGNFKELLHASAKSPAMLVYLDNQANLASAPNENYAREIMELHSLGVGGGYSQNDVMELARCFTGWRMKEAFWLGDFAFEPDHHDQGDKQVLGRSIQAAGVSEAEAVVDLLARHPSTARHLAFKLARFFIDDTPNLELVEQTAEAFLSSSGDITTTLRTLLMTGLATDDIALAPRYKRPSDFVESTLRAADAETDGRRIVTDYLARMGQPMFEWPTPDGPPHAGHEWEGNLLPRWQFALAVSRNELNGTRIDFDNLISETEADIITQLDSMMIRLTGLTLEPGARDALANALRACQFAGGNVGSIFGKDAVLVFGNHVVCVFTRDVG